MAINDMSNSLPIPRTRKHPPYLARWILISGIAAMLIPGKVFAETAADAGAANSILFFVTFTLGIIGVSVLLIVGLTHWGHKQDQIQSMMFFCIKSLVESKNESEKIHAARALGDAQDPSALLILVNIVGDDNAGEDLRKAAGKALQEMSRNYHQYTGVINDFIKAAEEKDHKTLIELLIKNFENQKKTYAQSAYLIGREHMRMEQYIDARIWLKNAKARNKKSQVDISQISQLLTACNQHLFNEGDRLFKNGEYRGALDHYALASHNLALAEQRRYSVHDRLACIYCKLMHYEDAYQETLHALQDNHKTDTSLNLNNLLHEMRSETGNTPEAEARRDRLDVEIAKHVENAMVEII